LLTRAQFLNPYQPLAVRAESKSRRISRQIDAFTGIQEKPMPMIPLEGPELAKETLISQVLLLHPHRFVGGNESGFRVRFEARPRAIGAGRRYRGDTKPKQDPRSQQSVIKQDLIPGSRLVIEIVPWFRSTGG